MKRLVWLAPILMLCVGCNGVPSFTKYDVKAYAEKKAQEAFEKAKEEAEKKVEEIKEKVISEVETKIKEKSEEVLNTIDMKQDHAQARVAKELGLTKDQFDKNGDGKLDQEEKEEFAAAIAREGAKKKVPAEAIFALVLFAVFGGDVKSLGAKGLEGVLAIMDKARKQDVG